MSSGLFSIGVSGLNAAQLGLLVTQHNTVNADTPGYTRQRTVQATNIPFMTGSGSLGQGVHVQTIQRLYSSYLVQQVNTAQTTVSQLDAFYSQIARIDNMLANASAGFSPALQDFFSGVQTVAANPSDLAARQVLVSSAQTMSQRLQSMSGQLSEIRAEVNGRIGDLVADVNSYAAQIADLNQRIIVAEGGTGQPANDLLDQRDQLVNQLNQIIKVTTSTNTDGTFNVFFGSGQPLVLNTAVMPLAAMPSAADPSKIVVGMQQRNGPQELPESLIIGGALGGLVSFRATALTAAENELGRTAASLSLTFNAQLGLGQDLLGNIAGDPGFAGNLFSITTATPLAIRPNANNTGGGSLSATFAPPVAPQPPDYAGNFYTEQVPSDYQITFGAGGNYTVTRLSDNAQVATGAGAGTVSFDGIDLNITATGNTGDRFTLKPYASAAASLSVNANIAADPRLIAAAGPVGVTPAIANTGTFTISQGVVGVGYSTANVPTNLQVSATDLQGVPGTWTAVYSDGTQATGPGNIALTSGAAKLVGFGYDGMYFTVAGTPPAAGADSFTIDRNIGGVQDGRNAQLLANLQTQNTMDGGKATYQSAYARLVASNGISTRESKIQLDAQTAVLQQAQNARDALSAVNLDEEAANLLKYQQAYQAASKVIQVGNTLFQSILAIF
ncbi:MAG: flagellar hook-associated protein FlgK [Desulfobulbus sp.]|nr:flagellar hook-associated protein FlgK [Desulfobulbus sp.]